MKIKRSRPRPAPGDPGQEILPVHPYKNLRAAIIVLMVLVAVVPLTSMYIFSHLAYRKAMRAQIMEPLGMLVNKTRHSFDLFLAERRSAVSFIASAYTAEQLADQDTLAAIFQVMKREFGGFVDLGLIDARGRQISYVGPYQLIGKNYQDQDWFAEVRIRGAYISDVFMGHRKFPHFVIAVQKNGPEGGSYTVRATIDTDIFNGLINSMGLDAQSDAFVLNRAGVLQTPSKFYGHVLEEFPTVLADADLNPTVEEISDPSGRRAFLAYAQMASAPFTLVLVKPAETVMQPWQTFRAEVFLIFCASILVIFVVVFKIISTLIGRIEASEEKSREAFHEMEHTNKLASVGRLAAGVAHEINNPMAIIDQKAGLMMDIIEAGGNFEHKDRFLEQTGAIIRAVDRCRSITHRLLGFARHMDVEFRNIDINEVIREVLGFLEKEAMHRNIELDLQLEPALPLISSDQGQLQQVFLNIINNALSAVDDGGRVRIRTFENGPDTIGIDIEDNGIGMSEETVKRIFEPFFTTKKGYGTGLGLSITYGIIKKLGGDIRVKSRKGAGTIFTVILNKQSHENEGSIL